MAISRILSEISPRSFEPRELFPGPPTHVHPASDADTVFGYPPCHLAAMHGHQLVAFELWRNSASRKWELDWLQRTPVHTAAYAGKTYELQCVFDNYATAATDISKDIFGMTPLMIAACKDDVKTFNLLCRYGADLTAKDFCGRNLLALAARNGNLGVVKLLLYQDCIPPSLCPESSALCEALTHNRSDTIGLLINHYSQRKDIDQHDLQQIQAGITIAKQKGLNVIAEQLESLYSTRSYNEIDSISAEASCMFPCDSEHSSLQSLTDDMIMSPYYTEIANNMDWNVSCHFPQDLEWTDVGAMEMTTASLSGTIS